MNGSRLWWIIGILVGLFVGIIGYNYDLDSDQWKAIADIRICKVEKDDYNRDQDRILEELQYIRDRVDKIWDRQKER